MIDCGSPRDPIEVMTIEQLALAHFALGRLQCRAANARQPEAIGVLATAAARMMGEFRRSSLGLQAYRAASRQLAHDPTRDLIIPPEIAGPVDDRAGKKDDDAEMGASQEGDDGAIIRYPGREEVGDQPAEPAEVAGREPRRKGKAPRRGAAEPPVGEGHRAADG